MDEFEKWACGLGVKYPPSDLVTMEWAFKAGYEAGLRRALDVASEWHTGNSIREAILAEIKGE